MEEINDNEFRYYLDDFKYQFEKSYRSRNKIKLLLKLYIFIGLLTAIIAGLYFLLSFYQLEINSRERSALMVAGVGLLLSLMAKFSMDYMREREKEMELRNKEVDKVSSFIMNWATLERTINKFVTENSLSKNRFAIGRNLDLLYQKKLISNKEYLMLERALDIRNGIVHGNIYTSNEELEKYNLYLIEIIEKLLENSVK